MKYKNVWDAVDKLAKINGLSTSGLAKKAGLDSTTFNKSKRLRPDGKKRWPSLESINKIIEASGISFEQFCNLVDDKSNIEVNNAIPYIKYSKFKRQDGGRTKDVDMSHWEKVRFPDNNDVLFAVDVDVDDFDPVYKNSSILIVVKNSEIRRGDRVLTILNNGETLIAEFIKRTASAIELVDVVDGSVETKVMINDIKAINRVVWASQ